MQREREDDETRERHDASRPTPRAAPSRAGDLEGVLLRKFCVRRVLCAVTDVQARSRTHQCAGPFVRALDSVVDRRNHIAVTRLKVTRSAKARPLVGLSPCLGSLARFGSRRARSQPRPPREPRAMALSLSSDAFGSLDASRTRRPTASKAAPFMAAFGLVTLGAAGVNFRRAPRPPLWSARRAAAHTANPTVPRSARLRIASRRRAASRLTTTAKRRRSRTSRRCSRATISRRRRAWP